MRKIFLFAFLMFASTASQGASFDCAKTTRPVEHFICEDKDLSSLDDLLYDVYSTEMSQEPISPDLKSTQKAWLSERNSCVESECVRQRYEQRIAQLSCSPQSRMAGSAIGSNRCSYLSLRILERELSSVEARYNRVISEGTNNPEYTNRTLIAEQKAWREYRATQCALYGATEGGSDGWKNAFASMCEVKETERRITRLKKELDAK